MSASLELIEKKALANEPMRREDLYAVLWTKDDDILSLVSSARRVREKFFGKKVKLQHLVNIKSGVCPEDCAYCSQSKVSAAPVQKYALMSLDEIKSGVERGREVGATKICLVASERGPSAREVDELKRTVETLRQEYPEVELCASLGLLTKEAAQGLKDSGLGTINLNINTSEAYYGEICTTHSYRDRLAALDHVRAAGLHMCSGILVGMGEKEGDLVDMAMALRDLNVDHIPVNFLLPVEKTPLAGRHHLTPYQCLRILALIRFTNPAKEIRIAGGREYHLRSLQPLGLMIADSIFIGDYLTTKGQSAAQDLAMIRDLGYTILNRPDDYIDGFFARHPELQTDIGQVLA